jgi:NitT/TauT family transport system ATP-binding protein
MSGRGRGKGKDQGRTPIPGSRPPAGGLGETGEHALLEVRELEKAFAHPPGAARSGAGRATGAARTPAAQRVIAGLSLSIGYGEFVTVAGPSGCGKSTLLRLLGGFLSPDSGSVLYRGREVHEPDPTRVMMFQEFDQLFPWKTVGGNVEFPLSAGKENGRPAAGQRRSRTRDMLQEVGLAGYEGYYPHQLSGGMKQRAALARTLIGRPEVVLMDEPFGSVDAQKREELQDLLLSIRRGRSFSAVFVTHDIQEAVYLADRVVVMGESGEELRAEIPVGIDRPRDREDERLEELRARIRGLL